MDELILELPKYLPASNGVHAADILDWWKRQKEALHRLYPDIPNVVLMY